MNDREWKHYQFALNELGAERLQYAMKEGGWTIQGSGRHVHVLAILLCDLCGAHGAEPPPVKLFDLSRVQLRPMREEVTQRKASGSTAVEELHLQTGSSSELDLLVQRHETMNGSPVLLVRPAPADKSKFARTLDSFLPRGGGFLQKNPNALSSPLSRSEYLSK